MTKPSNPKDAVGIRKPPTSTIPQTVIAEIGVGMLEGALKYGRHNYRVIGVRSSVYYDAANRHLDAWWEGEDIDQETGLSHITKAITSLVVLRDAMLCDKLTDDRPPKSDVSGHRAHLTEIVGNMLDRYPEPVDAYTENNVVKEKVFYGTNSELRYKIEDSEIVNSHRADGLEKCSCALCTAIEQQNKRTI